MFYESEDEFEKAMKSVGYYTGNVERATLDGEWTEGELKDDLWGVTKELLNGKDGHKGWLDKHIGRALIDSELCKIDYLVEKVLDENDLIEVYNKEVDKHRNDEEQRFGVYYYDKKIRSIIERILNNNLVTK